MLLVWLSLPLLCSIFIWIIPYFVQKKLSFLLIAHSYIITFVCFIFYFFLILKNEFVYFIDLGNWFQCGSLTVNWSFQLDGLSLIMLGLVSTVSMCVHFFSLSYMSQDSSLIRFFSLLSLFTFFMYILILSDNFLVLFLGWEGIGICSFLLISFWHTRISATKSALKAIFLNRVGDSAFIAGCGFIFMLFKSLDFSVVFTLTPYLYNYTFSFLNYNLSYIDIISLLFVIGAIGKSAQLGLHGWLPEAMEGPTPVSALIHAATLVTAGVFLLIRISPILEYSNSILIFILILGGLTCIFGSTVACAQNDVKKIIAFSTTSQLGYMFFACGLSSYNVALFHLFNHGFFKALLFLCAGAIIHSVSHEQDIRKLGGFIVLNRFVYSCFLISVLTLIGAPFLSGFFSKELILELAQTSYSTYSFFIAWIGTLSACLTAFYGTRCLYLIFLGKNNSPKIFIQNISLLQNGIKFALIVLVFGSIYSGLVFRDILVGPGFNFFSSSIYIASTNCLLDSEYISWKIKIAPLFGTVCGLIIAISLNRILTVLFSKKFIPAKIMKSKKLDVFLLLIWKIKRFLNNKWFLDFVLNNYLALFFLKHSYETFYKVIDKGVLEILFINGLSFSIIQYSKLLMRYQNGYIYSLICFIILNLILFSSIYFFF